jgi:membrane protein
MAPLHACDVRRVTQHTLLFGQMLLDDGALSLASLVAWGMLNTLLPLFLGVLSVLGLFFGESGAAAAAEQTLLGLVPASLAPTIQQVFASFQRSAGVAGFISLLLLLLTGSNLFVTLESVFDVAYHVPQRSIVKQRLVSLCGLFAFTFVVLLATATIALGLTLRDAAQAFVPGLWSQLQTRDGTFISCASLAIMFTPMYRWLPNRRNTLKFSVPGAAVAAVVLIIVSRVFPLYTALFGQGSILYAAFGSVLLFVFWLYCVGLALVGGAELNAFLEAPERASALAKLSAQARQGRLELPAR